MSKRAIKVLLVYTEPCELDEMMASLRQDQRIPVVGQVGPADDLVAVAIRLRPRVVVISRSRGASDVRRLRLAAPSVKVVGVCEPSAVSFRERCVKALAIADTFVLHDGGS